MEFLIRGPVAAPAVLLVHGMGCGGEHSFRAVILALENAFRVIVPLLDGYGGAAAFTTIEDQARQIAGFLKEQGLTRLHAAVGMSMGGFICLELFSRFDIHTNQKHLLLPKATRDVFVQYVDYLENSIYNV